MGSRHTLLGMIPVKPLWATLSCSSFFIAPVPEGSGPWRLLKLTSKTVSCLSNPTRGGRHPVRLSFSRMISFRVLPISPMLLGMHPPRLLFANTSTDTGDLPRFCGMPNLNLLSLRKMASRSLSKSLEGTAPSNSLYRRSKYLRDGNLRTTSGNLLTKRLLLRSSSRSSFMWRKVEGTLPQKRLELRWNRARYFNWPSSGGKYPAMSAWLRSMPATTRREELDGEEAQKIPL